MTVSRIDLADCGSPEKLVIEILKAGFPFLALSPHSLADVYSDIAMIAGIVGVPDRGEKVIGEMQREIEDVRQRVARPSVASQTGMSVLHNPVGVFGEEGRLTSELAVRQFFDGEAGVGGGEMAQESFDVLGDHFQFSIIETQQHVAVLQGRETMGDHEAGASGE